MSILRAAKIFLVTLLYANASAFAAVSVSDTGITFPDNSVQKKAFSLPVCSSGEMLVNLSGSWYCGKIKFNPTGGAIATCIETACTISTCSSGFSDCDSNFDTGCEVNITTLQNCGACGVTCPADTSCKTHSCTNGTCTPTNAVVGTNCPGGTCNADGICVQFYICGDGIVASTETCDDGNTNNGDGCSSTCMVEAGFTCSLGPSSCSPIIGDGLIRGYEQCDDGNTNLITPDGCTNGYIDSGYTCIGEPSVCNNPNLCTPSNCHPTTMCMNGILTTTNFYCIGIAGPCRMGTWTNTPCASGSCNGDVCAP